MSYCCRKFNTKWQWLQLLCIREEIPDGINRHTIPDAAWQKSRTYAPYLKVQLAIGNIFRIMVDVFSTNQRSLFSSNSGTRKP